MRVLLPYQARGRWFRSGGFLGRFRFLAGSENGMQGGAFHARHKFDDAGITHVLNEPVDNRITQLAVRHLATLEAQRSLYLVAFAEEANGLVFLGLIIVLIYGHRKLDLFDDDHFLLLTRCAVTLVFFVEKLAVILNAADRGHGAGRYFDEVEAALAGDLQCFKWGQDAELLAGVVDDANLAGADFFVDADKRLGRTLIDCVSLRT